MRSGGMVSVLFHAPPGSAEGGQTYCVREDPDATVPRRISVSMLRVWKGSWLCRVGLPMGLMVVMLTKIVKASLRVGNPDNIVRLLDMLVCWMGWYVGWLAMLDREWDGVWKCRFRAGCFNNDNDLGRYLYQYCPIN